MKRDLALYRTLLLGMEEQPPQEIDVRKIDTGEVDDQVIYAHVRLLIEAEFVAGKIHGSESGRLLGAFVSHITHEGHDFLDSVRDDTVWRKTQQRLGQIGGTAALQVVKTVAMQVAQGMV